MRLDRISLAGVLRFTDPVTVDLASLPAGLIAVTGPNGEGKSTLVEAPIAALYRGFPSRDGRPLVDYATTRDAFLEAVFTVDTRGTYRARVNLDGQRRAADAVLVHTAPDGTTTTLNDGKLSTYDEAVARVFPSLELLLASAVAAQNRAGSFITKERRGRKELLGQLLGLDRFEAMSTTARQAAARCDAVAGELNAQRRVLEPEAATDVGAAIAEEHAQAVAGIEEIVRGLEQLDAEKAGLVAQRDELRTDAMAHERAQERLRALAAEAASLLVRHTGLERQRDAAHTTAQTEDQTLDGNSRRAQADFNARIAKNRGVLERAVEVRAAADAIRIARNALTAVDAQLEASTAAGDRWQAELQAAQRSASEAQMAVRDLERATRTAERLAGVCDACTFVADAREAQASLPALQALVDDLPRRIEVRAQIEETGRARKTSHDQMVAERQRLLREIAALAPDAELLPRLEEAEHRITELEQLRDQDGATTAALRRAVAERLQAMVADLAGQVTDVDGLMMANAVAVTHARAERDRTAAAAATLADVDAQLAALEVTGREFTSGHARLQATVTALVHRQTAWRAKAAQIEAIAHQVAEIAGEAREWALLAKALGRDGLPVLEIDAAGPTVSAYTNDLLAVCFGPRFTVELITQADKADGKGTKEVCDLRVLDNLRGGDARELTDLSGGEQILVDEALKNALALFINARQAGAVETMWRDETTGPLDPENALRYVDMLRRVREIGHVRHVLFVSHNPAAAARADVQLRLADGRVTVHRPPFQEAA